MAEALEEDSIVNGKTGADAYYAPMYEDSDTCISFHRRIKLLDGV